MASRQAGGDVGVVPDVIEVKNKLQSKCPDQLHHPCLAGAARCPVLSRATHTYFMQAKTNTCIRVSSLCKVSLLCIPDSLMPQISLTLLLMSFRSFSTVLMLLL